MNIANKMLYLVDVISKLNCTIDDFMYLIEPLKCIPNYKYIYEIHT